MSDLIDTSFIPSMPDERKKMFSCITEAAGLKQIQQDKGEQINDIISYMHEEWNVPKKQARKMINTYFKGNYQEVAAESAAFELYWETIVPEDNA